MNNTFELNEARQIDSALNKAIVPIVLQTIQKASFEVWANKIDEAVRLKDDAITTMLKVTLSETMLK